MNKPIFYHAGCSVCVTAEEKILHIIGRENVDIVHFGEQKSRIEEAQRLGVTSVPALVIDGTVLHINFGASMEDVRKAVAA